MSVTTFIATIVPYIQKEAKARGYKICSTVIAQAIIESRYGESGLAKYHNYFGLKCGSSWKGASVNMTTKEEYKVGTLTTIKDNFRAYPNMEAGVKGYYDFINTKRYANLKTAKTYAEYAQMLKNDGYATSSTYVSTLVTTVQKYSLYRFDDMPNTGYIVGLTYTTLSDLYIRDSAAGEKVDWHSITTNAQLNAFTDENGYSILKKRTRVTCKAIKEVNGQIWMQIPSGWICAKKADGTVYVSQN